MSHLIKFGLCEVFVEKFPGIYCLFFGVKYDLGEEDGLFPNLGLKICD